jgi:hypothetical protein
MPIISAIGEVGGLCFKAAPGKSVRSYLKNKLNQKKLGASSGRVPAYQSAKP